MIAWQHDGDDRDACGKYTIGVNGSSELSASINFTALEFADSYPLTVVSFNNY